MRSLTKNWANTQEPTHADLKPLLLSVGPREAVERVRRAVDTLRGWKVQRSENEASLHLLRRTRVFRFVDDIWISLEPVPDGTLIHASSRSRLGKGDLGQNRRNILELWKAIQTTS